MGKIQPNQVCKQRKRQITSRFAQLCPVLVGLLKEKRHRMEVARLPEEHFEDCMRADDGHRSLLYYVQRQEHNKKNYRVSS